MNKILYSLLGLLLIGVVAAGTVSAFGFGQNEEAREAIENGDYASWREARMNELTEEHFAEVQEHSQNREIRQLGREDQRETKDAMRDAIEDNDYDEWLSLAESLENYPLDIETITEEDFSILVDMHEARASGDFEGADELAEELGWEGSFGEGRMEGHSRMQEGQGEGSFGEGKMDGHGQMQEGRGMRNNCQAE